MNEHVGTVKFFNKQKGWGIILNEYGEDVFVHYKEVPGPTGDKNLLEGDVVRYHEGERDRGKYVLNILEVSRT